MKSDELKAVEREITECNERLRDLRMRGLHLLVDEGTRGIDATRWLIDRGMTGQDARPLVATLIKERREG